MGSPDHFCQRRHFFDSPLSLFQYLADVAKYSRRTAQELVARCVTDAETKTWIAAETAMYVGWIVRAGVRAGNLPASPD